MAVDVFRLPWKKEQKRYVKFVSVSYNRHYWCILIVAYISCDDLGN